MHDVVMWLLVAMFVVWAIRSAYQIGHGDGYESGFNNGSDMEHQRNQFWSEYEQQIQERRQG